MIRFIIFIFFISFQAFSQDKCVNMGIIKLKSSQGNTLNGQFTPIRIKLSNYPSDDNISVLNDICAKLKITDGNNKNIDFFINQCSYSGINFWLQLHDSPTLNLKYCYVEKSVSEKLFPLILHSKNLLKEKKWVAESKLNKLSISGDLMIFDTSTSTSAAGSISLSIPPIKAANDEGYIELEYRFKNVTDFGRIHQSRVIVGQSSNNGVLGYTSLLHPIVGNPGRFVIWQQNNKQQPYIWLNNLEVDRFYRIIERINLKKKFVDYYIYDDNFTLLMSRNQVPFPLKNYPQDSNFINMVSIGDHCGDAGKIALSYLIIRNNFNRTITIKEVVSDYFVITNQIGTYYSEKDHSLLNRFKKKIKNLF